MKKSKNKIKDYNLPVIPSNYFVELNEAQVAIREIIKELDKKPITIEVLNTRVDTARDLVLYAEKLFFKGEYQKSLEISINSLNRVEKGIYDKLLNLYSNEK